MESAGVRKLARALRVMVVVVFACNLIALLFVPFFVMLQSAKISLASVGSDLLYGGVAMFGYAPPGSWIIWYGFLFLTSFAEVWAESYTAVLTVFLWACGVCTAVILWQARRVLDTILTGRPSPSPTRPASAGRRCAASSSPGPRWRGWCGGLLLPLCHAPAELQLPVCADVPHGGPCVPGHVRTVPSGGGAEGGK